MDDALRALDPEAPIKDWVMAYLQNKDADTMSLFHVLGSRVANDISRKLDNRSFLRHSFATRELTAAEEPIVYYRSKQNLRAIHPATGEVFQPQEIAPLTNRAWVNELYANGNVEFSVKPLQAREEIDPAIEKGYLEVLNGENEIFFKLLGEIPSQDLTDTITWAKLKTTWAGIKINKVWISKEILSDLVEDPEFVLEREALLNFPDGLLGKVEGIQIFTDIFWSKQERILKSKEFLALPPPSLLGMRIVRSELRAEVVNKCILGIPRMGWFLTQILSPVCYGTGFVVRGSKAD